MHPDAESGAIQAFLWLNEAVIAAVMRSGAVRLLMRDDEEGVLEVTPIPKTLTLNPNPNPNPNP